MHIRHKFILATVVPIMLLILQVLLVSLFVRELQNAVRFISTAQDTIEADLRAQDRVSELRELVRHVPQLYVQSTINPSLIKPLWNQVGTDIDLITTSPVLDTVNRNVVNEVTANFSYAATQMLQLSAVMDLADQDMDTLLLSAVESNDTLNNLNKSLHNLALELRRQLQNAVDREKKIHNRPIIAGVIVGVSAVGLLILLVWLFVERGIVRRLTTLSDSMLSIAKGDLQTSIPSRLSQDEIGQMTQALVTFRNTAIEVQKRKHLEEQQKKQQRQFWLEHMAAFLRHEVKNKQVGAEQSIRLLMSKEVTNLNVVKYCNRATSSLVDMRELINSTVNAADIESALNSQEFEVLDLKQLITRYVASETARGISRILFIDEFPGAALIKGDQPRLDQLLDKLVGNAYDFKDKDTDVVIRLCNDKPHRLSVRVENHGPALQSDVESIFGLSFTRREGAIKQPENVGFGLFVARRIAQYHFGTIEAQNSDSGVVFSIGLPVLNTQ